MDQEQPRKFTQWVDVAKLSKVLTILLLAGIALSVVGIGSGLMERSVLHRIAAAANDPTFEAAELVASAQASDSRQLVVGVCQVIVSLITIGVFLRWLYVTCCNCHVIAVEPLKVSPVWSICSYCVPVLNLFIPFQAMRQTWNVSEQPDGDPDRSTPPLLIFWWLCFLITGLWGRIALAMSQRAEDISDLLTSNAVLLGLDAFDILATYLAYLVAKGVARMQAAVQDARLVAMASAHQSAPAIDTPEIT